MQLIPFVLISEISINESGIGESFLDDFDTIVENNRKVIFISSTWNVTSLLGT